jgi:hypothetical protein
MRIVKNDLLRLMNDSFSTRQAKIGMNEWWLEKSRGSQAWSTAQDSESCPAEVREFKSRPLHFLSLSSYRK